MSKKKTDEILQKIMDDIYQTVRANEISIDIESFKYVQTDDVKYKYKALEYDGINSHLKDIIHDIQGYF